MQSVVDFFCHYAYNLCKKSDEQAVKGGFYMDAAVKSDKESVMAETEENQQNVREMVMESYHDMQSGKGRDCKEFFSELESRYDHAGLFEITRENDPFYGESNTKVLKESIEQMERHPERNVVKTLEELEQMQ